MINIAILASGAGTNAENIIKYFHSNDKVNVALVLSNNSNAGALVRAMQWNVPSFAFPREAFAGTETVVLEKLREYKTDFIVLAGFMNKVTSPILDTFHNRIVNIHPALLPKYGGKGMYGMNVHKAVIEAGEKQSGITIHYINENYDEGNIIFQATCPVLESDTPETLAAKVHELEYKWYPLTIENILLHKD
ncbi:MAG: phosphoribosylglycinamide formyltransferase [Tannerellaceae bacterium]|jgi:phosphoribosylglycinamide formyltransferase-1|nr:phosphoribosylglycinamide formyltransferase [Tannerellaceae bacterium]